MATVKKTKPKTGENRFNLRTESWSYEKFDSLSPYVMNRDVEPRVPKVVKLLSKKYLPIHSVVTVGVAVKPFGKYKKGEMFRLDGNTRAEAFRVKPELIPSVPFNVTMIDIESKEEADEIYYGIDSSESVETNAHKVTGYLREREYEAVSKTIKLGRFKTALTNASKYCIADDGVTSIENSDFEVKLDYFWDEIVFIDQTKVIDQKDKRISFNVLTSLLLICKKYGTDSERVNLLINNVKNSLTEYNDQTQVDGVHYMLNDVYRMHSKEWTITGFGSSKILICKVLYYLDRFVIGETIKKPIKKISEKKLIEFFQNYLSK
jgi:hypothetical protein